MQSSVRIARAGLGPGSKVPRLVDYTTERLRALCVAARFDDVETVIDTFRKLVSPWADRPLGRTSWSSEISDDNTPIELSVAIADGRAEVRALFEPQGSEPTLAAYRAAGLALNERLERDFGADLSRFRQVEDLFLPENMQGPFAVWSSVVFASGRAPTFKAYLNAQAHGREHALALVEQGFHRLGLRGALTPLVDGVLRRGESLDELKYFALDLAPGSHARVKVYVRHHLATPRDLELACSAAGNYLPEEALGFARAMGGGEERLTARACFTCTAFAGEYGERPASTTLYIPVCAYARDDAVVRTRVRDYLVRMHLEPSLYTSIVDGFANRPLHAGVGMQSWIALCRSRGSTRLTVYLGTEANQVYAPGIVPAPTRVEPAGAVPACG